MIAGKTASFFVLYLNAIFGKSANICIKIAYIKETTIDMCSPDMARICAHPDRRIFESCFLDIKLLFPVKTAITIPAPDE